jgi:quercetin dioxygenase-like cupin family protein
VKVTTVDQSLVVFADVTWQVTPPASGTLSRTAFHDANMKIVLFGFAAGGEVSEHTALTPAVIRWARSVTGGTVVW